MKKLIIFISILIIIFAAFYFGGNFLFNNSQVEKPFSIKNDVEEVQVKEGDTLYNIIQKLNEKGIIKNNFLLKLHIKNNDINPNVKPGKYEITKNMTFDEFITKLENGYVDNSVKITIPEGYTIPQIADAINDSGLLKRDDFLNAVNEYILPDYIKEDSKRDYKLEGYLFPDTYTFEEGVSSKEVIDVMLKRFNDVISEIEKEEYIKVPKGEMDSKIIMASIIEKETGFKDEKSKIASVFYNRLNIDMALQTDATVQYAIGVHREVVSYDDTEYESPYNTYKYLGLPPGPIGSPGKDSIIAALKPAETDYLYFCSKNDGTHIFNVTYEEHQKAVAQYQDYN